MQFNVAEIKKQVSENGYAIVRNPAIREVSLQARDEYYKAIKDLAVSAPTVKFSMNSLKDRPWKKYAIGSRNGVGENYAQLLQTTYFLEKDKRFPNLTKVFDFLIDLRNQLVDCDPDFGSHPEKDQFWNACRVHHYPNGGGFMSAHKDTHFPPILKDADHPFLQVMSLLSERGSDFNTGGGFIVDRAGKKIYFEDEKSFGDIVIFDGSIVHGVEDIDSEKVLDLNFKSGRLSALVSLYKVLA